MGGSEGWDGTEYAFGTFTIIEDLSAPTSDSVARIRYPVGQEAGTGPVRAQTQGFASYVHGDLRLTELYVESYLKLGPTYHADGVHNKLYFFRTNRGSTPRPEPYIALMGNGDGTFNLRVDFQDTPDAGYGEWPATGLGQLIVVDTWYKLETYLKLNSTQGAKDGIFRQWINGELVIERTDVEYRQDSDALYWHTVHMSPTFGGTNGEDNPIQFDFFLDHMTVRGRWGLGGPPPHT